MSSPSKVVAWECGACAYNIDDATCRDCLACQTRRPVHYAIMAGAMAAGMARTLRVHNCEQACVATLTTAVPAVAGEAAIFANGAVAVEAPTAAYGPPAVVESAAMHLGRAPQLGRNCASIVACLVNTMANIVGASAENRGRNCPHRSSRWGARFASAVPITSV